MKKRKLETNKIKLRNVNDVLIRFYNLHVIYLLMLKFMTLIVLT